MKTPYTEQRETHRKWMHQALEVARQGEALGEVPVGAVIVYQGELIASAHNEVETANDPTSHAEILAIGQATRYRGNWRLNEAALYVTLEPCPMCIGAILLSRISELYFGCYDPKMGAVGSQFDLSNHKGLCCGLEVYPELLVKECAELLQGFFSRLRLRGQ